MNKEITNGKLTARFVSPTRPMLEKWIADMPEIQRKRRSEHVARIVHDMVNGDWADLGDPIRFAGRHCVDGQHRIQAWLQSGIIPDSVLVITGLSMSDYPFFDAEIEKKSVSDVLKLMGVANCSSAAAVARMLLAWRDGWEKGTTGQTVKMLSASEVISHYESHPDLIQDAIRFSSGLGLSAHFSTTTTSALFVASKLVGERAHDAALDYIDAYKSGIGPGCVSLLRSRITGDNNKPRRRLGPVERAQLMLKNFHGFRQKSNSQNMAHIREYDKKLYPILP